MPASASKTQPGRVVTFGEGMIRLTPPRNERFDRTQSLDITIGGAELNVAVTLACLGVPVTWVSALPDTGLGRNIARQARANGVETGDILWTDESAGRTGVYDVEVSNQRGERIAVFRGRSYTIKGKPAVAS